MISFEQNDKNGKLETAKQQNIYERVHKSYKKS